MNVLFKCREGKEGEIILVKCGDKWILYPIGSLRFYLAVSDYSISVVLVKEDEEGQSPIYYVSKRLLDAETHYTSMEKLVYALVHATRKLRPYFHAHKVEVRTAYPFPADYA